MKKGKIFDKIIKKLNENFEKLPDRRRGKNTQYEIRDAAVEAFGRNPNRLPHDFEEKSCLGVKCLEGITYSE